MMTNKVIRTQWHGCYKIVNDCWGTRLQKTYDPEGQHLTDDELSTFELAENFARLPQKLLHHIVSFFAQYQIESQVILVRRKDDLSVWDALVPRQKNTGISCESDKTDMISLTTGIKYKNTPVGWVESGSVHSHPCMKAYWSGVDDSSELKWTGVHITIGGDWITKKYTLCSSICIGGNRYVFKPDQLVEGVFAQIKSNDPEYSFVEQPKIHTILPAVKEYVTQKVFVAQKPKNKTYTGRFKNQYAEDFYADPFHVLDDSDYTSLMLQQYDKEKGLGRAKKAIEDYLLKGGKAELLRQIILEVEDEIFTMYNF